MIKFFRKIRQKNLTESKFGKYLLYAIGEILLVVVGILIALNINNWNELKIKKRKEQHALIEVKSDLELNILSLNKMVDTEPFSIYNCLYSLDILITNLEVTKTYHDSLAKHFSTVFHYPDMDIKTSGYGSLTSMGMDLISDNHLRSKIGKFYTYTVPAAKQSYNETRDDFYNYMLYHMRSDFIAVRGNNDERRRIPIDYESLKNNLQFIESLKIYKEVFEYFEDEALLTLSECEKLLKEIEEKLEEV